MVNLQGEHIRLRALEPTDLDFLYELENNTDLWEISGTTTPYSKHVLKLYLDNAHRDIYDVKQLRLCIVKENKVVGLIDLFDFDPQNKRVGVGIVVLDDKERNKGIGTEAVSLLTDYVFQVLGLRQLYANVLEENAASLYLFKKLGFVEVGIKKDWIFSNGMFKNEILLQKIKA
ncbi:GNAT family protein [Maribacter sp. TH_r10]|uniref:GNAT family N-acetyltransferase n=1 Tax=Maribacter luteus TaxID=2594478 RepID=A0A6I2MT60_9FLAO|nr:MULTISPECIES: GNAT family protein [Maribacter]MDV7138591.1 GNAT family protein [Maribacter sp. TH_r10]MRX66037.1 GNAT family N-acetyltransferase [Maribacter luteus]